MSAGHAIAVIVAAGLAIGAIADIAFVIARRWVRIVRALRAEPEFLECPADWLAD